MSDWNWITLILGIAIPGLMVFWWWRPLRPWRLEVRDARAREAFSLQRERLENRFRTLAAQSGLPRGLRWIRCEFQPHVLLARDRHSGQLVALAPVVIAFEAIPDGPMEGVEAVGQLREATAVFKYAKGHWDTEGRAIFNLLPDQALERLGDQFEIVPPHP